VRVGLWQKSKHVVQKKTLKGGGKGKKGKEAPRSSNWKGAHMRITRSKSPDSSAQRDLRLLEGIGGGGRKLEDCQKDPAEANQKKSIEFRRDPKSPLSKAKGEETCKEP